jgi:hypothetical protein
LGKEKAIREEYEKERGELGLNWMQNNSELEVSKYNFND